MGANSSVMESLRPLKANKERIVNIVSKSTISATTFMGANSSVMESLRPLKANKEKDSKHCE